MTRIANTIVAVATGIDPDIRLIRDRSRPLTTELIYAVIARSQCHYAGRRPKAPTSTPTDMDLASYLMTLYQRRGVVALTPYTRLTPRTEHDVRHIGTTRFGTLIGLVSHREYLSFGLRLYDASVIANNGFTEHVGQARSFTLLSPTGDWHVLPGSLDWHERADEALFNQHHQLSRSDITTFVHRNRRESVMGAPYLVAKCLLMRLCDEIAYYERAEHTTAVVGIRRYQAIAGELVPSFTMRIHGFTLTGTYQVAECNQGYREQLISWRQLVQWLTRINEYAFFLHGQAQDYTAPWVRDTTWQPTGDGRATLALHPNLSVSYHLRYVTRTAKADAVPLTH
jgi:hypothetical protein